MIFQHSRFQIWNQNQHPYKHNLAEFGFSHGSMPGVTNVESALNYFAAVIYPNSMPAVATTGDLPLVGNSINDFRVVSDNGDGKAAAYRWEQREGDVAPSWYKIYDLDWGTDSILQAWEARTLDLYVFRRGYDDLDIGGNPVSGLLAGQSIYGGKSANTNLNLFANSGDGTGPNTGFIHLGDDTKPLADNAFILGSASYRFKDIRSVLSTIGSLSIASNSLTSATGTVTLVNNDLFTTGVLIASHLNAPSSASTLGSGTSIGNITISNNSIISGANLIDFGAALLSTTNGAYLGNIQITGNDIISDTSIIQFGFNDLTDIGTIYTGTLSANQVDVGPLTINGSGNIVKSSTLTITAPLIALNGPTISGYGAQFAGNILSEGTITAWVHLKATDSVGTDYITIVGGSGGNTITSQGNPLYISSSSLLLDASAILSSAPCDLGDSTFTFKDLYLSGSVINAAGHTINQARISSLRNVANRLGGAAPSNGDSLFWHAVDQCWYADHPDSEIDHGELYGLSDDDHLQYVAKNGRATGQSIIGGTGAGENLDLESTSNALKGFIRSKDTIRPFTDAAYSGSWSGVDLGHTLFRWNDVYSAGEFKGLRVENMGALPPSSSQKVGRLLCYNDNLYMDTGIVVKQVGNSKINTDTVWNGTDTTKDIAVSGVDATTMLWQLKYNTNDFDIIYCSIKAVSTTTVRITVGSALPAGTYRLIGV